MARITVTVTGLNNLVVNKQFVEPAIILNESETIYKALKLEGATNVNVVYEEENGTKHTSLYIDSPIKIRAFAAFIMILSERWKNDEHDSRLAHHYALPLPVAEIIDIRKLTKETDNFTGHCFVSIRDVIKNWLQMDN